MTDFTTLPSGATLKPTPFTAHAADKQLEELQQLISLSPLGPKTFENQHENDYFRYGLPMKWLEQAKHEWTSTFDWRKEEEYINSFPNYTVPISDSDGQEHKIHFVALFSTSTAPTTPLLFMHGWPGSFLEFLPILDLIRKKYTPATLPYHVVVPSLPGYTFSEGPSLNRQWTKEDGAHILDKLMVGLGLKGYIAQGGDIGASFARVLAVQSQSCKAAHLNFCHMSEPKDKSPEKPTAEETKGLERLNDFKKFGSAYAFEHGTRQATIGVVLSSSPIALLAWIAEKFLSWSDAPSRPSTTHILNHVSLYWLTSTFPRAIYPYASQKSPTPAHEDAKLYIEKPFGYSWFPLELAPVPVSWAKTTGNLVWSRRHERGGHFAAMEVPEVLLDDVEEFVEFVNGGQAK